jgi:hypothetical protein
LLKDEVPRFEYSTFIFASRLLRNLPGFLYIPWTTFFDLSYLHLCDNENWQVFLFSSDRNLASTDRSAISIRINTCRDASFLENPVIMKATAGNV